MTDEDEKFTSDEREAIIGKTVAGIESFAGATCVRITFTDGSLLELTSCSCCDGVWPELKAPEEES